MGVLQQAGLHHVQGALVALLTGLEHKLDPAVDLVPVVHQQLGGAEEHGGVGIVPAGVHRPGALAGEGLAGVLHQRQGVHIRPEQDHLAVRVPVQHGDHAAAHRIRLIPHLLQLVGDIGAGVGQVSAHLRVLVDMAAPAYDLRGQGSGLLKKFFHDGVSSFGCCFSS